MENNVIAKSSYASVVLDDESRLVVLDENGDFIDYQDLSYFDEKQKSSLFSQYKKLLKKSDVEFAGFLYSNFCDVVIIGKCGDDRYVEAVNTYGKDFVNKIGRCFVVER
jgi:hypothetical protein